VRAGQGERRIVVVKGCACPRRGVMAGLARGRETGCRVRGIIRIVEIRLVAPDASGGHRRKVPVHVALRARHRDVRAGQREGRIVVVKRRGQPGCGVVACLAGRRESRGNVVRVGGPGEVLLMTAVTI